MITGRSSGFQFILPCTFPDQCTGPVVFAGLFLVTVAGPLQDLHLILYSPNYRHLSPYISILFYFKQYCELVQELNALPPQPPVVIPQRAGHKDRGVASSNHPDE